MKTYLKTFSKIEEDKYMLFLIFSLLLFSGCQSGNGPSSRSGRQASFSPPPANDDYFQEIGLEIGLYSVQSIGDEEITNIVESNAGGAAFLDYDKDGFIDLYVTSGTWKEGLSSGEKPEKTGENHLYHNLQNGTFEDVTKTAGVNGPWYSMGATAVDFNNDGYPDIFISNYGLNVLLKNNGNGTFSDVTESAKVAGGENDLSLGATWFDYDNDGFLDLYVGNCLSFDPRYKYFYASDGFPGPLAYDAQPDILYHNTGNEVFEDVTKAMGINDLDGRAMGVGSLDYDDDGFQDIYVANDRSLNYLWHNDAGKGFTESGAISGTESSQEGEPAASRSVDFADYNRDGLMDIFLSDNKYCSLYQNMGNGLFMDKSYPSGIAMLAGQFVGWSSLFIDYDNDGDADILKVNGALKHLYGQEDQLFENIGEEKFVDVSTESGQYFEKEMVGRGSCLGDYDNDGDIDSYIVNLNSRGAFLRNNKGNKNNWITLNLVGTTSNYDGIGTRVKLISGGEVQTEQKKSSTGYLSQSDPRMHFGLSKNDVIEKIEIKWPSGKIQYLENVKPNQVLTVTEP
jgi:enediyne biosynthesis protein E4